MSATVLIAGCGDLGCEVGRQLVASGHRVIGLRRSDSALPAGVVPLQADVTDALSLQALSSAQADILVYCVAADAHSDDSYRASYVDGLRNVLAALQDTPSLRHVFFVSSTGIYGQDSDALLDETDLPLPDDFSGIRMQQAEQLLHALPGSGLISGTVLRLSGIYGPGRQRMIKQARDPLSWPPHNRWTNRIHRDDAAGFICFLIDQLERGVTLQDCYLVTDSKPVAHYEVLQWLAAQMGVDSSQVQVPPPGGAKRLSNARLLHTGYQLRYSDYSSGYRSLLDSLPG